MTKMIRGLEAEWNADIKDNIDWNEVVEHVQSRQSDVNSNISNGVNSAQGVNTANGVNTASSQVNAASSLNIDNLSDTVIYAFLDSQPNSTHLVNEDMEQIHPDDLEEINLKWQMAMLTTRARRFLKNTRRKLNLIGNDSIAFDKTKLECYNCHKRCHFARECRAPRGQDNMSRVVTRKTVPVETPNSSALVSCDGLGGYAWSDQAEEGLTNYALMAYFTSPTLSLDYEISDCSKSCLKAIENLKSTNEKLLNRALTELQRKLDLAETKKEGIQLNVNKLENASKSLNKIIECQTVDNYKKGLGYNTVPPPHIGLFPPPKSNLSYTGLEELFNEPKTKDSKDKSNDVEPKSVKKDSDAPIIEDWVSDDEEENVEKKELKPSINWINFVKDTTNNPRETVKNGEQHTQNTHRKRGNQRNWNGMMSHKPNQKLTTLKNNYDNKKVNTVWVKKVNTAKLKATVNAAKVKAKHKAVKGKMGNAVKASACGIMRKLMRDMLPLKEILKEGRLLAKPVVAQSNDFSGTKASNGTGKEKEAERDYILLPCWTADSPFSTTSKSSQDNEFQPSNDGAKKVDEDPRKVNAISTNISIDLPPNLNMPSLKDISIFEDSHDDEDVFGIEAIRLFLAYASFKDFIVYQMDVKSAFLYGKIEEEVCEKASTPIETSKPLLKDEGGEKVDVHMYRSMIGSLMYLTSSRPDIMFATVVANSTTESEYVAASSCCGQVLWIQNQLLDYRVNAAIDVVKVYAVKYN
uniref:CCHC-type domain-containing protein n=1 Tax=Tanacetum cinerariifolium TaxID=118510 RepID=A0A6L2KZN0_TANCI|nr:hypothetical protein [Tanacetum cinerariifolium]